MNNDSKNYVSNNGYFEWSKVSLILVKSTMELNYVLFVITFSKIR